MGIDNDIWKDLGENIDLIIHAGAYVHSILPYSTLKPTNVNGTLELIKLCCFGKPKVFHFVSTAGLLHGISDEKKEEPMESFHPMLEGIGGYSQSKWVAERLLNEAHKRGLRCSISRPSRISPHSITGLWNPIDYMVRLHYSIDLSKY